MFSRSFFALVFSICGAGVIAQTTGVPAEMPPVGYTGSQFVDSRGCVFNRVGVDDAVRWVPRVNPARRQVCGRSPTFPAAVTASTPPAEAPVISPDAEVVIVVPQVAEPAPAGSDTAVPVADVPRAQAPAPVVKAPAPVVVAPAHVVVARQPSPVRNRRVGPSLVGTVVTPATAASKGVPLTARVLPRHVYEERLQFRPVTVPPGHRKAWSDGRLNPRRAEQTLQGHADMQQLWTRGVPMREQER
ncbi:hypothetical protein [Roseobacter ponti]|uniref:Uncharacterized protein n=1 Tax=Roseobacter ponti TaxID=1891787 RepID=A0A858SV93_9RHOB|nr:hypothetical protein [Roseobacter ponti]QJF52190.1 hypothetical protein G3256_13915 [Roseobacter ponti]